VGVGVMKDYNLTRRALRNLRVSHTVSYTVSVRWRTKMSQLQYFFSTSLGPHFRSQLLFLTWGRRRCVVAHQRLLLRCSRSHTFTRCLPTRCHGRRSAVFRLRVRLRWEKVCCDLSSHIHHLHIHMHLFYRCVYERDGKRKRDDVI
jgi:hypothetical protein